MAITLSSVIASPEIGGTVLVSGLATFDSLYATGGEVMDLSSYILSTASPIVTLNGDDGYVAKHDRGTAVAGKVLLYYSPAGNSAAALTQVAANTNAVAVVCTFFARGTAP